MVCIAVAEQFLQLQASSLAAPKLPRDYMQTCVQFNVHSSSNRAWESRTHAPHPAVLSFSPSLINAEMNKRRTSMDRLGLINSFQLSLPQGSSDTVFASLPNLVEILHQLSG